MKLPFDLKYLTSLLHKQRKKIAVLGLGILALWLAFGAGQIVGEGGSVALQAQGAKSLAQLHQMVDAGSGGVLRLRDHDVYFQDRSGHTWRIPDFYESINRGEMAFLEKHQIRMDGRISIDIQPASAGAPQAAMGAISETLGKTFIGIAYGVLAMALLMLGAQMLFNNKGIFSRRFKRLSPGEDRRVGFDDVAGHTGPKQEVMEVVDYLRYPDRFQKTGARVPKGILLYGPPGNGKTMLAKAIAGEANAAFLEQNASSFVQLYVGAGAMAVRALFKEARKLKPCVLFIDEIDAVGANRNNSGAHDERLQTINALLAEIDGFSDNEGIVVIAATNRIENLDDALVRPGRFDRKVYVPLPGKADRLAILQVHANRVPDMRADLPRWAALTQGFSGADLANLVNEAAIEAGREGLEHVTDEHFSLARDRVLMGPKNHGHVMTARERRVIAYHESGHAVARVLSGQGIVEKVSILPRGLALGITVTGSEEEVLLQTRSHVHKELLVFLGGRAAEEVFCGEISSGAANDLERASSLARKAVLALGLSTHGPYVPEHSDLRRDIEEYAAQWITTAYAEIRASLQDKSSAMHLIAQRLLEADEVPGAVVEEALAAAHDNDPGSLADCAVAAEQGYVLARGDQQQQS